MHSSRFSLIRDPLPAGVEIYESSNGGQNFLKQTKHSPDSTFQMIRSPWMQGIDLDRYIDIAHEEEEAFLLYDLAISKALNDPQDPVGSLQNALDDINAATLRLLRMYELRRRKLNFQGVTAAIGSVATVGSTLMPADYKPIAAAIGGATAMQAITWIRDRIALSREIDTSVYWFLWRSLSK